jgi:hypothetical protein
MFYFIVTGIEYEKLYYEHRIVINLCGVPS